MSRIKSIIFDLGGVLLDLDVHRCLERLEEIGLHEVRQWMTGTNEKGFFKEYECGILTTEQFRDRIREEVGRELSDEEIDRIWNSMLKEIPDYKFELLLKLKENYNLYLLSNTNDLHWKECAGKFTYKGMPMLDCFTQVFLSYRDSEENCQAAAKLGIGVCHYVPGDNLEVQLQKFIV